MRDFAGAKIGIKSDKTINCDKIFSKINHYLCCLYGKGV